MFPKKFMLGVLVIFVVGVPVTMFYTDRMERQQQAVRDAELRPLIQERDAWRSVGMITIKQLARQDLLIADRAIIVVPAHRADIGLFPDGDILLSRELLVPVPLDGDRAFHITYTPEGYVDDIRLLPLPASP